MVNEPYPHRSPEFLAFMDGLKQPSLPIDQPASSSAKPVVVNTGVMRVKDLVAFIKAREAAREWHIEPDPKRRARLYAKLDPIIQRYRFCNMRREDDRTTRWLDAHWRRPPHSTNPDLWFAMVVARCALNDIETMAELGFPVPWEPRRFLRVIKDRIKRGDRVYGPAYMIATPGWSGPKHDFLVERLLTPLWKARKDLRPRKDDSLASFHARLVQMHGVGSFTAAQVVADLKYTPQLAESATTADDWWTWAAPGPGSKRGLNRILGRPFDTAWKDDEWLATLQALRLQVNRSFPHAPFHAQDLQNALCEFDKYERARLGEGKPKQLYTPFKGDDA